MKNFNLRPRLFVVTPTFNSSETLDQTVKSVLELSQHCDVFHHVQDAGSKDGTLESLRLWEERLSDIKHISFSYASEDDEGIYDAISKGFERFVIEPEDWMCWINSDDQLDASCGELLSHIDKKYKYIEWVTGNPAVRVSPTRTVHYNRPQGSQIIKTGSCDGEEWFFVQQEGTFWRGKLWAKIDKVQFRSFRYAGDYFLWLQFAHFSDIYQSKNATGYFNVRLGQASQASADKYAHEVMDSRIKLHEIYSVDGRSARQFNCLRLEFNQKQELMVSSYEVRRTGDRKFEFLEKHQSISGQPRITVITVVFNDADGLRRTFESVKALNWHNLEYLVVDGGSTDDTLSVIKDYNGIINEWISESDDGIYDAMNKGVDRASGQYVIFMNAGDEFAAPDVLSSVFGRRESFPDVIYGDRYYVSVDGRSRLQKARHSNTIHRKMFYFHQAVFIRLSELRKHRFDSTYRYAGDYHQAVRLIKAKCSVEYVPIPFCMFYAGGASESELGPALEVVLIQYLYFSKSEFKESIYLQDLKKRLARIEIEKTGNFSKTIQSECSNYNQKQPPKWFSNIFDFCDKISELDFLQATYPLAHHFKHTDDEKKPGLIKARFKKLMYLETTPTVSTPYMETGLEFYWSMVRKDYDELLDNVKSCVPKGYKADSTRLWTGGGERLNSDAMSIYINFKKLKYQFSGIAPDLKHYLYIVSCETVFMLWALRHKIPQRAVFFSDMQPLENITCQFFNMLKIPTTTLQHGLYIDYGDFDTDNVVNYLNQPSKNFLAWGKDTAALIKKYHPETKVQICGKPILASSNDHWAQSEIESESYISIIFDSRYYDDYNMEMLKVVSVFAEEENLELNVRFHPRTDQSKFRKLGIDFFEDLQVEKSCFVVGHTSSMIVELMAKGLPVFKFYTDASTLNFPKEIVFRNADQLKQCSSRRRSIDFQKISADFIDCYGNKSLDGYRKFFADFLQ
mgnify:CR=1 FL=1